MVDLKNEYFRGSCKELIAKVRGQKGWDREDEAQAVVRWIKQNGGLFFRDQEGKLSLLWDGKIYSAGTKQDSTPDYFALIYDLTGIITAESKGRQFFEYLHNIALLESKEFKTCSWGYSERQTPLAFFNPNNEKGQIITIGAGDWTFQGNGTNSCKVLLIPSKELKTINVQRVDDPKRIFTKAFDLFKSFLATDEPSQALFFGWLLPLLLIDLAIPRPLLRLEGNHQSGKTTACKLLYRLIYGREHKASTTVAAIWRDSAINPLILIDNLENTNMKQHELIDFLLLMADGSPRQKCDLKSATNYQETRPHCILICNGIEPFPGNRPELNSRTLVLNFSNSYKSRGFIEADKVAEIESIRDEFYSAWIDLTTNAIKEIKKDFWRAILLEYEEDGDLIGKERLRSYLAISQLYCRLIDSGLEDLFRQGLAEQNISAEENEQMGNPIVKAIEAFFEAHDDVAEVDRSHVNDRNWRSKEEQFHLDYGLKFTDNNETETAKKSVIFNALKKFTSDRKIDFPYENFQQFNSRFGEAKNQLRKAGYSLVDTGKKPKGSPLFILRREQ